MKLNITRRTAMMGAAGLAAAATAFANTGEIAEAALATDDTGPLPTRREKIVPATPPFVHPHEQVAKKRSGDQGSHADRAREEDRRR